MTADIKPLPGRALTAAQSGGHVNADLVERLEILLSHAKSGNLQCLMYAGLDADGATSRGWVTRAKSDAARLLGETHVCAVDIASTLIEDEE